MKSYNEMRVERREAHATSSARRIFQLAPSNSRLATHSRLAPRNGILLLVVLSMLVLFLMLGTAFVILAKQSSQSARSLARAYEAAASPMRQDDLLDEVFGQLLRDTNNQNSALRFHSLLRDLYGNDGFVGQVSGVRWASDSGGNETAGQIIEFELLDTYGNPFTLGNISTIRNAYNGQVLTFTGNGNRASALGQSVRILGFKPITNTFRVMAFNLAGGQPLSKLTALTDLDTSHVAINGRPFNGTGVGFDTGATGTLLTAAEVVSGLTANPPLALLPNATFFTPGNVTVNGTNYFLSSQEFLLPTAQQQKLIANRGLGGLGGSDESYDAVDYQNMFLGLLPPGQVETVLPNLTAVDPGSLSGVDPSSRTNVAMPIPSLHRPALLNWWRNQLISGTPLENNPAVLRKVLLRPNWWDHPNFTGSNPDFPTGTTSADYLNKLRRMIYGPWDVDNDSDGIRDSVWVDFGAPVIKRPNGTMVKPLAAILCLDLDGRLNLNAHGSIDLARHNDINSSDPTFGLSFAGNPNRLQMGLGQGYGPADISLNSVLTEPVDPANLPAFPYPSRFDEILFGEPDDGDPNTRENAGRYGQAGTDGLPGRPGKFGPLAQLKMQRMPRRSNRATLMDRRTLSAFTTPPDLHARYAMGLNDWGQQVHEAVNDTTGDFTAFLNQNTPYELNLSAVGAHGVNARSDDMPFTVGELERLLRAYDSDAGELPARIWELAGQFRGNTTTTNLVELNQWRTLLTTDSYDLPVPNVQAPNWMYYGRDLAPGNVGQDDNNDGITDNDSEIRWPGSDDLSAIRVAEILGSPGPPQVLKPPVSLSIVDLLRFRIKTSGRGSLTEQQISNIIESLLAPELLDGQRMDINRPLGNGRDDNNNGIVDEPGEMRLGRVWKADINQVMSPELNSFSNAQFMAYDLNQDGLISTLEDFQARQLLARHLYVLAMTLVDPFNLTTPEGKAKTRRLAQWAMNVVDFRDPDSIMTPFEYDENPFDGWGADGDLSTTNDPIYTTKTGGVIWGAERPELLISEVLAWHDRRTEDRTNEDPNVGQDGLPEKAAPVGEPGNTSPELDLDFDQLYRPRGAAFIELYNPWPDNPGVNGDIHRVDANGNDLGVDLARTHNFNPNGSPVWRLAIYRNTRNTRPDGRGQHLPVEIQQSVFLDPDDPAPRFPLNELDRCVYFSGRDPGYDPQAEGIAFFNDGTQPILAVPPVQPGKYLLVGSGDYVKRNESYVSPLGDLDPNKAGTTLRRIQLKPNDTNQRFVTFIDPVVGSISPPRNTCNVAIINRAPDFDRNGIANGSTITRRFTLSEPAKGYPDRVRGSLWNPNGGRDGTGWYGYGTKKPNQPYPIDTPLDNYPAMRGVQPDPYLLTLGTVQAYRWIFLQRLANPLLRWNPEAMRLLPNRTKAPHPNHRPGLPINPYVTIDSSSANLTVFNGRVYREMILGKWVGNGTARGEFSSVERGWHNDPADLTRTNVARQRLTQKDVNLWARENSGVRRNSKPADSTHFFSGIPDASLGFLNSPFDENKNRLTPNQNGKQQPFPSFQWNNRPYISAMELLQVPPIRSSRLLQTFSLFGGLGGTNKNNPYVDTPDSKTKDFSPDIRPDGPFGHLQNFYRDRAAGSNEVIVGLHRILDYVHVPSRFVGTETWLNPNNTTFGGNLTSGRDPRWNRQAPFNRISTYRDPGRVNLNTIWHGDIWDGGILQRQLQQPSRPWDPWNTSFANNYLQTSGLDGPLYVDTRSASGTTGNVGLLESRRGYELVGGSGSIDRLRTDQLLALNPNVPTFFANPFRSPGAGNLVPLQQLLREGVDCGLVRSNKVPTLSQTVLADVKRLAKQQSPNDQSLMVGQSTEAYRDASRNSSFRYQPLTRLANLTTNHSNVFAVWVTIGFFEVEDIPTWANAKQANFNNNQALYNRVYPDGYSFGREAGSETGDTRRLRGFAIIDRTIPVAFDPGREHNSRKAIRLRRRIE